MPIGFQWNGNELVFGTPTDAPKLKVLRDGVSVAVTIDGDSMPYHVLLIREKVRTDMVPGIAPAPLRIAMCVALAVTGAGLAALAYRRWGQTEAAMRNHRELPFSGVMLVMTIGVAAAAAILAVLILVAR